MNYFRITGYNPKENFCFIMDSNGKFNALWEFSAYVVEQGLEIIKAGKEEKFLDGNIRKTEQNYNKLILRAYSNGKPETTTYTVNGINYKAIKVKDKIYIPDKNETV